MSKENEQELARELSALLEKNAEEVRSEWMKETERTGLRAALPSKYPVEERAKVVYEVYVQCLKTGSYEPAERYATDLVKRAVQAGLTFDQVVTGIPMLRDVQIRFIFQWYHKNPAKLYAILDVYQPVARKILDIVAVAFVAEKECTIKEQQEAMVGLSIPLVEVWDGVVMVPVIGTLDSARAKQLTESVLNHVAQAKTNVAVIDISGIAALDTKAANHIIRAMQAIRLMGSDTIITGIKPAVATTLVTLGIDMSGIVTRSTLREGLEYAYAKLGFKVTKSSTT